MVKRYESGLIFCLLSEEGLMEFETAKLSNNSAKKVKEKSYESHT